MTGLGKGPASGGVGDWASLWTPEVTALAVERYREDFEHFGYSTDPLGSLAPLPGLHGVEQRDPPQPTREEREKCGGERLTECHSVVMELFHEERNTSESPKIASNRAPPTDNSTISHVGMPFNMSRNSHHSSYL